MELLFATRVMGHVPRELSELLNISNTAITNRDDKEINDYFFLNSSTHKTPAL